MSNIQEITKELILKTLQDSKALEKKEKLAEALACIERISSLQDTASLETREKLSIQVSKLCNKLVNQVSNKVTYLRRAESSLMSWISLTESSPSTFNEKIIRMILITYNNWATFHQGVQNYHMALSYLMKGLQIIDENDLEEADSLESIAKTKLNVSALYSELHRYSDAVSYAEDCLKTLQNEFKLRLANQNFNELAEKEKMKTEMMIETYVAAFYNIGVNQEYLNMRDSMVQAFKNAVSIGSQFLKTSNEVLLRAKKALAEAQSMKNKTLRLSSLSSSIQPVQYLSEGKKHVRGKQSQPFPGLDKRFSKFSDNKEKLVNDPKRPGRYYSEARLKKLQQKIDSNEEMNFVSADQFFYREISKLMNVSSDIKFLKPLTTSGAMNLWERQVEEKLKISDLRLKKQHHLNINYEPEALLKINEKIEKLKEIDEEILKKQEIKMKSKMKTKVYKQLLQSLNSRNNKYSFPPQRN